MRETVLHLIEGLGLSPQLAVLLIAAFPTFELRGSVPLGMLLAQLPVAEKGVCSVVGNVPPA